MKDDPFIVSILRYIKGMGALQCARAENDLNAWEWPIDFPTKMKPKWWDDLGNEDRKIEVYRSLSRHLSSQTTLELIKQDWSSRISPPAFKISRSGAR